jgi:hypothetical protein
MTMQNDFGVVEYSFYNGEVTIIYNDEEHSYSRLTAEGEVLIPGVTTVVKIIDKSAALTQWAANMATGYIRLKLSELAGVFALENPGQTRLFGIPEVELLLEEARYHYKDIRDQAGDVGKLAHHCLEKSIKKALEADGVVKELVDTPEDEKARSCVQAALDWMLAHRVRWIATERKVYSRQYDYAGTEDGRAYVSGCGDPLCCPTPFEDVLSVIDWKSSNRLYDEYRFQTAAYEHADEEELGVDIKERWILRLGKEDGEFEPWHLTEDEFEHDFQTFLDALDLYNDIEKLKQTTRDKKAAKKAAAKAEKEAAKAAEKEAKAEAKAAAKLEKQAIKDAEKVAKALAREAKRADVVTTL